MKKIDLPFRPANILLPRDCDMTLWSVVACDQYTSQPEYWQRVEERVGKAPSTLRLILPESCLEGPNVETDIMEINNTMTRYLRENRFVEYPHSMIYVERVMTSGRTRRGLVGMVDLERYDYEPGSGAMVRATEGTVLSRIPPRVAVRKNAPIELPHIMLLSDDPEKTVIEPLAGQTGGMELLYDFELMEGGGHIRGWKLTQEQLEQVEQVLNLAEQERKQRRDSRRNGTEKVKHGKTSSLPWIIPVILSVWNIYWSTARAGRTTAAKTARPEHTQQQHTKTHDCRKQKNLSIGAKRIEEGREPAGDPHEG